MSPTASSASVAARTDAVFVALADRTRRDLLRTIVERGPITATALAAELPMTRQGVAKHLGLLADAGLVTVEREGREARYRADTRPLAPAARWLSDTESAWARRLDRLRRKVERR